MKFFFYFILLTPFISFIDCMIGKGTLQYFMLLMPTYLIIERKLYKNILPILIYIVLIGHFGINILNNNPSFNYITLIRWTGFMLVLSVCSNKLIISNFMGFLKEKYQLVKGIGIAYLAIEVYYYFFNGFDNNWDGKYFVSFYKETVAASHTNSYFLLIIQIMFMYIAYEEIRKKNLKSIVIYHLLMIVPVLLNLLTGARTTSIIALFVLGCYVLKLLYDNREILKQNIKLVIYGVSLLIILLIILIAFNIIDLQEIPLVQKFMRQINNGNFMSSRDRIWLALFDSYFNEYSINQMFFGRFFGVTPLINDKAFGEAIWAHNDFMEVLMSSGILGLGIYLSLIWKLLINYRNYVLLMSLVLIANFNGLMNYPVLAMSVPLLISIYCLLQEGNYDDIASDWKQTNVDLKSMIQKFARKK